MSNYFNNKLKSVPTGDFVQIAKLRVLKINAYLTGTTLRPGVEPGPHSTKEICVLPLHQQSMHSNTFQLFKCFVLVIIQ